MGLDFIHFVTSTLYSRKFQAIHNVNIFVDHIDSLNGLSSRQIEDSRHRSRIFHSNNNPSCSTAKQFDIRKGVQLQCLCWALTIECSAHAVFHHIHCVATNSRIVGAGKLLGNFLGPWKIWFYEDYDNTTPLNFCLIINYCISNEIVYVSEFL